VQKRWQRSNQDAVTLNDATDATARNMRRFVGPERIDDARRAQQIRTLAELKGTSNNP